MIRKVAECGVDAVKLQKRDNKSLYTKRFYDSYYNSENAYGATYGEHREALEFGKTEYQACKDLTQELGMVFLVTAFDIPSVDFLRELNVCSIKIASGSLTNLPLISYAADSGANLVVSTGGGSLEDVERAVEAAGSCLSVLMQCTAIYPAPYETLNLGVIRTLREHFPEIEIGASLHDVGIAMSLAAYLLGATVIEKHFTLNRTWKGTDHAFSLEPQGMKKLVRDLRRAEVAVGDGRKHRLDEEDTALLKMSQACYFRTRLRAGHVMTPEDIAFLSPGGGLNPSAVHEIIGKTLVRDVEEEELISFGDFSQGRYFSDHRGVHPDRA
jgi:N-acetylneuraminate synthase/sialic acid synthase